ncbi:MAG: hypothetical protein E7385_02835 [Ruminococcaceae bacterium]|nr:hypothetical protein [Oscillospiraceae bacterium]
MKKIIFCFLIAVIMLVSCLPIMTVSAASFDTNMTGWQGMESTWTSSDIGYKDGAEQTVLDMALSDISVDGTKDFMYTVEVEKESGYGAGLVIGVKDNSSRQAAITNFVYFIADSSDNVYYRIYTNSEDGSPHGRKLTDTENASSYTLTVRYSAVSATATFLLDGTQVSTLAGKDVISGYVGLISHDASVSFKSAKLDVVEPVAKDPVVFTTNMTGWHGVGSTWTNTDTMGYMDDELHALHDFAFSDIKVDSNKSFLYKCEMQRLGGYGVGLMFGVPDISSADAVQTQYVRFLVDPISVTYSVNGETPAGRRLTDDELDPAVNDPNEEPMTYVLELEYYADEGTAYLYINENIVETFYAEELIGGYLGLIAHDARISVISADFQYIEEATPAPTQESTEAPNTQAPDVTQEPTPLETPTCDMGPEGTTESDKGCGSSSAIAQVMLVLGIALVIKKKK